MTFCLNMHHCNIIVIATSCVFLCVGCSERDKESITETSSEKNALDTSATSSSAIDQQSKETDIHFPHEAFLSFDPEISVPAVQWAVDNNRGRILESVWIRGGCPESRKLALRYFLRLETFSPELFVSEIQQISQEAESRIAEVNEVAATIHWHQNQAEQSSAPDASHGPSLQR